jgi:DNA-binding MarR family transcriptional regulator
MRKVNNQYCTCLYYSANALARKMTKMAEDTFATTGLAPSHAFLLMSINRDPGLHPKKLSEIMLLTPSTVTRLIEKLEMKRLVIREYKGKYTYILPTEKGKQKIAAIEDAWKRLNKNYTDLLGTQFSKDLTQNIFEAVDKLDI